MFCFWKVQLVCIVSFPSYSWYCNYEKKIIKIVNKLHKDIFILLLMMLIDIRVKNQNKIFEK